MIDVGALGEFHEPGVRIVKVDGRQLGIVRWSGAVYALNNRCAHQWGPLCAGRLSPRLIGESPGALSLDESAPVIACPWHGWEFDVSTGHAVWDESFSVQVYPVIVRDGRVLVELRRRRSAPQVVT